MSTVRYREDDSSTGTTIATVLLGAVAGFAVGMYLAQRIGGLGGIVSKLSRGRPETDGESYYEAAGEDFLDGEAETESESESEFEDFDDDGDADSPEPALEERVLEAFNNDPVLAERAIDIGAVGAGAIELEGWVDDDEEAEHAVTIARGVPGVRSVANRLMVDDGTT